MKERRNKERRREGVSVNKRIWTLTTAIVLTLSTFATNLLALQASGVRAETDRTWYLAGEAMTVSVTDDNASIAYAELCDTRGLAAGVVIGLNEDRREGVKRHGTGIIELPSDLHSGYYMLSVYTRNNAQVSQRLVAVINPLRKSKDDDIEWVVDSVECRVESGNSTLSTLHYQLKPFAELEGHVIMARVRNVYNGQTFKGSQICPSLSIVGKQIHYFEGQMVNDTLAVFQTFGIHGKLPLVLSAMSSSGVSLPIEMISPFATLLPKQLPHLVFHYKRSEVEARSLDMQRHQMIKSSEENQATEVPLDYDDTAYGTKPDLTYNLDEYRQFRTVREVLLEYVLCVRNTKINGVPRLIVRKEEDRYDSTLPSLVLIDGMPVNDVERLQNYDARRVHYINIYGGQYTFGNGVYNGILSLVTRSGRLTNYPTEPNVQYLEYDFPN